MAAGGRDRGGTKGETVAVLGFLPWELSCSYRRGTAPSLPGPNAGEELGTSKPPQCHTHQPTQTSAQSVPKEAGFSRTGRLVLSHVSPYRDSHTIQIQEISLDGGNAQPSYFSPTRHSLTYSIQRHIQPLVPTWQGRQAKCNSQNSGIMETCSHLSIQALR